MHDGVHQVLELGDGNWKSDGETQTAILAAFELVEEHSDELMKLLSHLAEEKDHEDRKAAAE